MARAPAPERKSVILDVRSDIAESIIRLGDYLPPTERHHFISSSVSIMLAGVMLDDNNSTALDAMDRLVSDTGLAQPSQSAGLLGEMLVLNNVFRSSYKHHDGILDELEQLMPNDPRCNIEEVFNVEFSPDGNFLRIR